MERQRYGCPYNQSSVAYAFCTVYFGEQSMLALDVRTWHYETCFPLEHISSATARPALELILILKNP